jgi:hypothetical protein
MVVYYCSCLSPDNHISLYSGRVREVTAEMHLTQYNYDLMNSLIYHGAPDVNMGPGTNL